MRAAITLLFLFGIYSADCQEFIKINDQICTTDSVAYTGYYRTYHSNGQSKALYHFNEGRLDQGVFFYNEDGSLAITGFYKGNKPDGLWQSWDSKGNVVSSARYDRGKKTGEWFIRMEHDTPGYSLSYVDNKLTEAKKE
ncbi:MAG: hypothetical protein P8H59_01880 [Flavobacteriales bacterium]|nr:hypothetical protein [Flavobacteriales bacterium]MDG1779672.1 hypothetical protein [Flavobacteriales bacterium]MDG2245630.1 hypothetical protein [Flavobacteriales bacterium]